MSRGRSCWMAFATLAEAQAEDNRRAAAGERPLCEGVPVCAYDPEDDVEFEKCAHCGTRRPEASS